MPRWVRFSTGGAVAVTEQLRASEWRHRIGVTPRACATSCPDGDVSFRSPTARCAKRCRTPRQVGPKSQPAKGVGSSAAPTLTIRSSGARRDVRLDLHEVLVDGSDRSRAKWHNPDSCAAIRTYRRTSAHIGSFANPPQLHTEPALPGFPPMPLNRFTRERSLVRNQPCPYKEIAWDRGFCAGHHEGLAEDFSPAEDICATSCHFRRRTESPGPSENVSIVDVHIGFCDGATCG